MYRKEYSSQYVFLRGNRWPQLLEDPSDRVRQLQQAANEPDLSERNPSGFIELHATGNPPPPFPPPPPISSCLKSSVQNRSIDCETGLLERWLSNGVVEFPNRGPAHATESGQVRVQRLVRLPTQT